MPLPAAYTAETLAQYMVDVLGTTAAALGWESDAAALVEAANEVDGLLSGGIAGEATPAGVMKVRALARWQAWLAARGAAAPQTNLASGPNRLDRSQWYDHLDHELYEAALAASAYPEGASALNGGLIQTAQFVDPTDPYGWGGVRPEFGG